MKRKEDILQKIEDIKRAELIINVGKFKKAYTKAVENDSLMFVFETERGVDIDIFKAYASFIIEKVMFDMKDNEDIGVIEANPFLTLHKELLDEEFMQKWEEFLKSDNNFEKYLEDYHKKEKEE